VSQRKLVESLTTQFSVRVLCRVLDMHHGSYYYVPYRQDDLTLLTRFPTYGYRRVAAQLRSVAAGPRSAICRHGVYRLSGAPGQPTDNPHAERVIRTIKEEEVYLSEYEDFQDAYHRIGHFIEDVYQTKRTHSALGCLTPAEFEIAYWDRQHNPLTL
jgi:transposase InsO family protein